MTDYSSTFTSCFRPTTTTSSADLHPSAAVAPPISGNPNLTTCIYNTDIGVVTLTWCRHVIGRALRVDLRFDELDPDDDDASPSFALHIKPFLFWRKQGSKKFNLKNTTRKVEMYWDLTKAKFVSGPEPQSGFYVAVIVDGEMILLVGDSHNEAYNRTKARRLERTQDLILRREHVFGTKFYSTKANFGGKLRNISIDCSVDDEPRLCFSVDCKKVLQIKQLKWKFRGNERIEVDGVPIQVSWDVFNWLFEDVEDGHAVFMFKFEKMEFEEAAAAAAEMELNEKKNGEVVLQQQQHQACGGYFGMSGLERKKLKKSSFKTRSSSSSSMSSASSACSSSVMEWESMEESELQNQSGFSLLVYAWRC